ncbi:Anti-proliferative protein [Kalmanozyma brasiliensis GHG001]|uniref:Anti-proliferative protein domain-containing protein n=1 Tax=Kalmanozyma brasiliensis (strain GHG001) TaxID=1365824 RepID=V5EU79_KALBG|nr:Anti-proliferative protein [Kalmanozyma brasiliensis GHG001]EST05629.1 Anti-proliferative protein [Kalmanozyma brasiliensis GHG001]
MIYEVAAAVDHIVSLIQHVERAQPIPSDALAGFASTLKDALEKRCQQCWEPAEPERGSALRSVAWQLHSAGEGADLDLLRAFASVVQAQSGGHVVGPHQHGVVALALQWLPQAFTLWIDPGCVAVRMGSGPGAARSSFDFDLIKSGSAFTSVHVIWGQMVAQPADREAPLLTVSSAPRPVPIVKPTATVAQPRYPTNLISNALPTNTSTVASRHSRSLSTASSASSVCGGLVRSVSYSSTGSFSTDATSLSGLEAEADAESETCPSLCSPFSSLASSHCTPSSDLDRDSVHDVTVGDTTERFAGVRLFADELEQDEDAGDVTIGLAPMLGLELSKGVTSAKTPVAASTPVKCNYTTHDNGNVGVLGGGVRLGGGSKSNNSASAQPPRHRQHSSSKSISHLQGGLHNQLLPAFMPRPAYQSMARQPQHMNAANYSAPLRTVPLPVAPHPQQRHLAYQQQQQQQQYHAPQPQHGAMAYARPSQLPAPYGYPAVAQQQPFSHYTPHLAVSFPSVDSSLVDAEADDVDPASGRRRVRSRGRRSRGRGAGRAARRQAAALRASDLSTTDEFFDGEDDDEDDISRCSTPATSDYTSTACSSIYSSATSSPVKQLTKSGNLSKRASRTNLRAAIAQKQTEMAFGQGLTAGLARLMA